MRAGARAAVLSLLLSSGVGCGSPRQQTGGDGGPSPLCPLSEMERTLPKSGISAPTTLVKVCSPYYLAGPVTVSAHLTIDPGVVVETCALGCESRLTVSGLDARLTAAGTAAEPIVFTPRVGPATPRPGEWTGIMIRDTREGSVLDHVVVEYAGGATRGRPEFGGDDAMVNAGLVVWDTAGVTVTNSTFRFNKSYGVRVEYADDNNDVDVFDAFSGNTFAGNTEAAMRWPVNQLGHVGEDNCFAGRDDGGGCKASASPRADGAIVEGDQGDSKGQFVTKDAEWRAIGVPYLLRDGAVIKEADLVIDDPNELWIDVGSVTVGLNFSGSLQAVAAQPHGIRFLSAKESPAAGDWDGILFEEKATPSKSRLENIEVAHAGRTSWRAGEGKAGIWIYNASPMVKGAYVHDTKGGAIHWNCNSQAVVQDPTYDHVQCTPEAQQNWGCPCNPFMACSPTCAP